MLAGLGEQPEACLPARVAGAGLVAEQGQAHFAGSEAGQFQAVGALHGVGGGPGVGHFFGLGFAEGRQGRQVGVQHGGQQGGRLARAGGAGQLQLGAHQLVAGHDEAVDKVLVLVDAAHGGLPAGRVRVQDAGAAPAGSFAIGPKHGFQQQAVELGLGRVVGPGLGVRHVGRAFELHEVVAGGAFVQQVEAALQAVGGRQKRGFEEAVGQAQGLLLVAGAAGGHEAQAPGFAQSAVVAAQVVQQLRHPGAGLELGQRAERQRSRAKQPALEEFFEVEVGSSWFLVTGFWLLVSCFWLFTTGTRNQQRGTSNQLSPASSAAHFLVQQQVHQVADHQRARGFVGQKRIQQRPFGDGAVLLGALGDGRHAHQVVGFEHHAAGPHAAIGQSNRADEVQCGVQRGGQRQHVLVSSRQQQAKRAHGPAHGGRGQLHGQLTSGQVGVQHPHPPRHAGHGRNEGFSRRVGWGFGCYSIACGRRRRQQRPRVGRAREVAYQRRHGREAGGCFGRGAGVAFVQHQVGGQAQGLELLAQGLRQGVRESGLRDGLVEVEKRHVARLAVVAQHRFEQLAQLGQLVGGRGGGVGGQGGEARIITGGHERNGSLGS